MQAVVYFDRLRIKEMKVVQLVMKQIGCWLQMVTMIVGVGLGMDERNDEKRSWA